MNHEESMQVMRAGTLRKRGTHKNDEFHLRYHLRSFLSDFDVFILVCTGTCRYVCVWATRIGYSLTPCMDTICDYIDINDVETSVAVDLSNKNDQEKCDFMVKVRAVCNKGTFTQEL
jgi:hypothetical protein